MKYLFPLFFLLSIAQFSFACPGQYGIQDYNCDGKVKIFFIGDSFTYGTGDTVNNNKGGYIKRLKKSLKKISIDSYSIPGLRAITLLKIMNDVKKEDLYPEFRKKLSDADIVILDLGRNDRWLMDLPGRTYRNLDKIARLVNSVVREDTGFEPMVIKAVLMLPNRGSQGPWVKLLNQIILAKSTPKYPNDLRFDLVSKRLIGGDQIHPTSLGYNALAKAFTAYLPKLKINLNTARPDSDGDGLTDIFETNKYGTNPSLADTDGDLKNDYDEIFVSSTNPLIAD
jgi:lysophospholipase L1-like esterase